MSKHLITVEGDEKQATVSCSCGTLQAQTISDIKRHLSAKDIANLIGQSHLTDMAVQELIADDEYVILRKSPTADTIVNISYNIQRATVQEIKDSYNLITDQGKSLTKLLEPRNQ